MTQEQLFAQALGISAPWSIDKIHLDINKREMRIQVGFTKGSSFKFINEAGEVIECKAYDTRVKTWRHLNFFQYRCYIDAIVPRVITDTGVVRLVKTPWEGLASGFTLLFEAFIMQLASVMPVHNVCDMIGTYDSKVWDLISYYTETCRTLSDYSQVKKVGMDETAARRGHDYVTIFVDMEEKKTLFVTKGKSNATVVEFVKDLKEHGGSADNITEASCDLSPAFIKGVTENLPNAEITFDKFHITKILNEAVDQVRKEETKTNPILKKSRYVWLKNQKNFTQKQREKYEEISMSGLNLDTFKAMQIRENFQQIYSADSKEGFESLLIKWSDWASNSGIIQMQKAAETIKKHWNGIISWAESKISNAILEGFNSIFQAAKSKARGYKKTETIKSIIYLLTAKLDYSKVNPYCATHSFL